MIADLEAFRKNPGIVLEFTENDLRPEETDEPTQLLRTGAHTASGSHHRPAPAREPVRRREYEEEEPAPGSSGKRTALLVTAGVVVLILVICPESPRF